MASGIPSRRSQIAATLDGSRSKLTVDRARPVDEEAYPVGLGGQGPEANDPFTRHTETLARGGEHRRVRTPFQDRSGERTDVLDEVLAVVQDQQEPTLAQPAGDRALQGLGRAFGHAQRRGHGMGDEAGAHRNEVHEHAPGRKEGLDRNGHLRHQPGLADPSRSHEAHQPRLASAPTRHRGHAAARRTWCDRATGRSPGRAAPPLSNSCGPANAASPCRSAAPSLRSSEDTWLSTVRTEMYRRFAISGFDRPCPRGGQHLGLALRDAPGGRRLHVISMDHGCAGRSA